MKKSVIFLLVFLYVISCSPSPDTIATQTAGVWTHTPELIITSTKTPTPSPTPIPWKTYQISYTIDRNNHGKIWIPIPREWDGIGMKNVEILSIVPEQTDLFQDVQGNVIAYWSAGNRGTSDYSITYRIQLAPIKYDINPDLIVDYDVTTWEYQRYTQPSEWIQSSNEEIVSLAHEIIGDESNPYKQARSIHSWVSTNISSGDIADAVTTLEQRSAGCGGHSWLFVALLRSLGIPARGVGGLHPMYKGDFTSGSARNGTLGIHIWSEFYLAGYGWIQSDTSAGPQNFAEINEPRIILFRGEDIELEYGYPLGTIPWFHSPNEGYLGGGTPSTQTWGNDLTLLVEYIQ